MSVLADTDDAVWIRRNLPLFHELLHSDGSMQYDVERVSITTDAVSPAPVNIDVLDAICCVELWLAESPSDPRRVEALDYYRDFIAKRIGEWRSLPLDGVCPECGSELILHSMPAIRCRGCGGIWCGWAAVRSMMASIAEQSSWREPELLTPTRRAALWLAEVLGDGEQSTETLRAWAADARLAWSTVQRCAETMTTVRRVGRLGVWTLR